jgi:hypothetical protein
MVAVVPGGTQPLGLVTQRDVIDLGFVPEQGMEDTCRHMDALTLPRCAEDYGSVDLQYPEACKPGPAIKAAGMYNPNFPPFVNRACWHNEAAAVVTRVLRETPWRRDGLRFNAGEPHNVIGAFWRDLTPRFTRRWARRFKCARGGAETRTSWSKWIKHFPPFRRTLYEQFRHLRGIEGIGPKERTRKAFIKKELGCRHSPAQPEPTEHDPRLIQGAAEEWSVRTALELHAYTKLLARVFHSREIYYYVSGSDCEAVGKWLDWASERVHGRRVMLTIDAKRFDSSVTPPALAHHHRVLRIGGVPGAKVNELRRREGMNTWKTARGVRYSFEAEVSSGHGDTSSGDSTISISVVDALVEHAPLSTDEQVRDDSPSSQDMILPLAAAVNGDDNTILTSAEWLAEVGGDEAVMAHYERAGFDVTLTVNPFPYGDFCSQLFWPVLDECVYVLGPKIGRTIGKTFFDFRARPLERHAKTVATGLIETCSFVPILRAVVERTLQLTAPQKLLKTGWNVHEKLRASRRHKCDEGRAAALVWHRYQLHWSDVLELETMIMKVPRLPFPLRDVRLDKVCAVDWELTA